MIQKSYTLSLLSSLVLLNPAMGGSDDFSSHRHGDFTRLKSPLGEFTAQSGEASINSKSSGDQPGSLRINGGVNHSVELVLSQSLQSKPLLTMTFGAERWTRADPFKFSIKAKQDEKWVELYNGDKLPLGKLGQMIQIDLKGKIYKSIKFEATTKEGSGVLIDNLSLVPDGDMKIVGLTDLQYQIPSLVRKFDGVLFKFKLETEGSKKADQIEEVIISTAGTTDLADVESYQLYALQADSGDLKQAIRVWDHQPAKKLVFNVGHQLVNGANNFALVANLKDKVSLSHRMNASLASVKLKKAGVLRSTTPANEITQRIGYNVATAGDEVVRTDGSMMVCTRMRIPGMVTTNEGTLLAVYDLRWRQDGDLPGDIDIGLSRSTDGGKSWEAPRPVLDMGEWLGEPENKNGVGDPAILVDRKTGHIYIAGLVAHGLSSGWYWGKSKPGMDPKDTGQVVIAKSEDDGLTWSKPRNLTSEIKDPSWQLMLQGPGAGISMRDGTLVFAFQYKANIGTKSKPKYSARSSIMYSKDHGKTWKVAPGVDYPQETTEAQVVELNDGSLMLNCRISAGGRAVFTTKDLGENWTQHHTSGRGTFNMSGCMASILRYSSTKDGDDKDILLFSGPADGGKGRRTHQSIRYSLDEGESWSEPYLIDQLGGGGYSSLSLIDNGDKKDIGIIYEGSQSNMTFERVTLRELMVE